MKIVEARNTTQNAKVRAYPGYARQLAADRVRYLAAQIRSGAKTADDLTSQERVDVGVYFLDHPLRMAKVG